ncbi:MAG: hypothetical protein ACRDHP_00115, partial [Ktedonobacterales bacterium]
YTVRPATPDDAPAVLALYERHYSRYTGSFARTLEHQRLRLVRSFDLGNPPALAVNAAGEAAGYLLLSRAGNRSRAGEVAADTWPAVAALLQHHAQAVAALPDAPPTLAWPLPPNSSTYYLLADNLDVPSTTAEDGAHTWVLRGETYVARRTAWMARAVSLRCVVEALLPAWQTRLTSARMTSTAAFTLRMGDETRALRVAESAVQLLPAPVSGSLEAVLTPAQLVQLVFGYRPASYLATQPGARIPETLLPLLDTLFPAGQPWIPWSDSF